MDIVEPVVRPWRDDEEDEFVALAGDARVTALIGDGSAWSPQRALVARAVRDLGVLFPGVDLVAETHLGNRASAAVLQRNGLAEEAGGVGRYGVPVRRFRRRP